MVIIGVDERITSAGRRADALAREAAAGLTKNWLGFATVMDFVKVLPRIRTRHAEVVAILDRPGVPQLLPEAIVTCRDACPEALLFFCEWWDKDPDQACVPIGIYAYHEFLEWKEVYRRDPQGKTPWESLRERFPKRRGKSAGQ